MSVKYVNTCWPVHRSAIRRAGSSTDDTKANPLKQTDSYSVIYCAHNSPSCIFPWVSFAHRRQRTKGAFLPSICLINYEVHDHGRTEKGRLVTSHGTSQNLPVPEFMRTSNWRTQGRASPAVPYLGCRSVWQPLPQARQAVL